MSSRGTSLGLTARTRKSLVFFWTALFVLSMALQYASAIAPKAALAAGPVVTLEDGIAGCNGVRPTPGSENTNKRLIGGSLTPGGTATFEISFPVDPSDVGGDFAITDCVFIDGTAILKYSVAFVPNNENFILTFTLTIPAGTPIGRVLQLREDDTVAVHVAGQQPQSGSRLLHRRRQHLGPQDQ